ncbi:alkaline phosphatase family protein [Spongisporangium articulatum]|uniref:Alkaline phosphatase family protein n=1 Tax=Spongisporangium articulatum TaxID=3362603 RepID=A0ABW8AUD8_9ACTN
MSAPASTAGSLADVLPAAAAALGVPFPGAAEPLSVTVPPARVVVVLLVDGLGDLALAAHAGHAPFLRSLRADPCSSRLRSGFPSTTATSLGMLGTGLLPGAHGLVGLDVLDPARDVVFNELMWDPAVEPRRWQPSLTVFEHLEASGLQVTRVGPAYFDGSGLTEAVQRGGRFVAAQSLADRVAAGLQAVRATKSGLVYVYWGEVDKAGHEAGVASWRWLTELEEIDAYARRLAEGLPADVQLVITADHGMVDVPSTRRYDLAVEADLAAGIRHLGGEPRAQHLYCRPGAADDVLATWRARLGSSMVVLPKAEAVAAGWFGPVSPHVLPRIGDVVTAAVDPIAVVDSRTARPETLALKGFHGARTEDEVYVPLLVSPGLRR